MLFRSILFLGGEPLRTDSHIRLLENIEHPKKASLRYTTNGSYRPDERTLEAWSKFKEVKLQFSIDGIGEHFNYLRWPLQWHQVESNLQYILDLKNSNVTLTPFSYTTTPLSLSYHDQYEDWAKKFFANSNINIGEMFERPWQPRGETPMGLAAVPPKLQQRIKEKYGDAHAISRLLEPFTAKQYLSFMNYIRIHDKHRQTNWRNVFPEMQEFYR